VIIRQRRVVDFFLDPFRKLQQDSLMFWNGLQNLIVRVQFAPEINSSYLH
jgi:hypothetical protein